MNSKSKCIYSREAHYTKKKRSTNASAALNSSKSYFQMPTIITESSLFILGEEARFRFNTSIDRLASLPLLLNCLRLDNSQIMIKPGQFRLFLFLPFLPLFGGFFLLYTSAFFNLLSLLYFF